MSIDECKPVQSLQSWTAESLHVAIIKGSVVLKPNDDGKAECWKKFRLLETADRVNIFGWAACVDCSSCMLFKTRSDDGKVKLFGTKNMRDHLKSCATTTGRQMLLDRFVRKVPGTKISAGDRAAVKSCEVRFVVQSGMSFAAVENPGVKSFVQVMINIGSKYGNLDVEEVLYGRQTVKEAVFEKMNQCRQQIKDEVALSSLHKSVSFCTDMTTDDVNKNSYSNFTAFWVKNWVLHHAMYKCEYFPQKHTAQNIKSFIDATLTELNLSLDDTPCTTDKGIV